MADLRRYRKWANDHPNFMTPRIVKLYDLGVYVVEVSEGTDFDNRPMFGVTVAKLSGSNFETQGHKYSEYNKAFTGFRARAEAFKYASEIKKLIK